MTEWISMERRFNQNGEVTKSDCFENEQNYRNIYVSKIYEEVVPEHMTM